jgi:hypothetical protein
MILPVACVQTGSEAHPASCTMGTGGPFPGDKARPGRDADHSPHLVPRSRMRSYNPLPPSAFVACSGTALVFLTSIPCPVFRARLDTVPNGNLLSQDDDKYLVSMTLQVNTYTIGLTISHEWTITIYANIQTYRKGKSRPPKEEKDKSYLKSRNGRKPSAWRRRYAFLAHCTLSKRSRGRTGRGNVYLRAGSSCKIFTVFRINIIFEWVLEDVGKFSFSVGLIPG